MPIAINASWHRTLLSDRLSEMRPISNKTRRPTSKLPLPSAQGAAMWGYSQDLRRGRTYRKWELTAVLDCGERTAALVFGKPSFLAITSTNQSRGVAADYLRSLEDSGEQRIFVRPRTNWP